MSYVDEVYAMVVEKNPAQPEFHQAVKEVLESLRVVIEANEEAYKKDGIVYKVPRGRYLVENLGGIATSFPDTMEEISGFLYSIYDEVPQLVWPLGQFMTKFHNLCGHLVNLQ